MLGILEGLAIEKVRIRTRLLVVLGEEGSNKVLLTELVRVHGRLLKGARGRAGRLGVGGKRESDPGRTAKATWVNPAKN